MFLFALFQLTTATINPRSRRELVYDGEFPNTSLSSRRSIFEDPRISSQIEENLLRRYQHLEKLISFYDQDIANITKYWSYGCWCFQMGDNPLRLGNGQPVDDLDRTCKKQKECYLCANKDEKERRNQNCYPDETSYKFNAVFDQVTNQPVVQCLNKKGSCKRNICECDKAFASNLKANENLWLFQNSQYSGFDQRANCLARISTPGGGGGHVEECCGEYPNRFPYKKRLDGKKTQCCASKTLYQAESHECCNNDFVAALGTC